MARHVADPILRSMDDLREPSTRERGTQKVIEALYETPVDVILPPRSVRPVIERLANLALDDAADATAAAAAPPERAVLTLRAPALLMGAAWRRWDASARRSTSTLLSSVVDAYLRPLLPPTDGRAAQPSLALLPPVALMCATYALDAGMQCFVAGAPLSFEHTWCAARRVMQCRGLVETCSLRFLEYDDADSSAELASVAANMLGFLFALQGFETPAWRGLYDASFDALLASNFGASPTHSSAWFTTVSGLGTAASLDPTPRSLCAIAAAPLDLTPVLSVLRGEAGIIAPTFIRALAMLVRISVCPPLRAPSHCFLARPCRPRLAAPLLLVCTCARLHAVHSRHCDHTCARKLTNIYPPQQKHKINRRSTRPSTTCASSSPWTSLTSPRA
jgi:hypothetical protein